MGRSDDGTLTLGLAGDAMLGRGVARGIEVYGTDHAIGAVTPLWAEADARLANLACALTGRRTGWEGAGVESSYLRADPSAAQALARAGVDAVDLANDHTLDYGCVGLADTAAALDAVGVAHAGAGPDLAAAERPVRLERAGWRISLLAFADRPAAWAAGPSAPGIRFVPMDASGAARARAAIAAERRHADLVVVSMHWGPAMKNRPGPACRNFARTLVEAGADVVWGHGAHVVQAVEWIHGRPVLYDAGDLVSDRAVDEALRNDLGALFLVRAAPGGVRDVIVRATRTRGARAEPAEGLERDRMLGRLAERCRELGTPAAVEAGVLRLPCPEPVARRGPALVG
ncbi:MAG: CapA family protein [Myxococcota bacterium]